MIRIISCSLLFIGIVCSDVLNKKYTFSSQSDGLENYSVTDYKWPGKVITFKVVKAPWGISQYAWDVTHQAAINMWQSVIPIEFKRVRQGHADIEVILIWLDGPDKQVAKAWPPKNNNDDINGDIHMDSAEFWYSTISPPTNALGMNVQQAPTGPESYIDLYKVMIHNYGHAIGMLDNNDADSVMSLNYLNQNNLALSADDVRGIQSLYGVRNGPDITVPTTTTTTTTTTRRPPQTTTVEPEAGYDKCRDGRLDAITMATDGEAYAFRGIRYFKLRHNYRLPVRTGLIRADWPGLPDYIDAAVYLDGRSNFHQAKIGTYFFKGFKVYRYVGRRLQRGYPKTIESLFPGIPHDLDSIFTVNHRLIAKKGLKCYEIEGNFRSSGGDCYRSGTLLEHLAAPGIDAAFYWPKYGHTYYFYQSQYWRMTKSLHNNPNYPKSTRKYFLGCK